MKRFVIVKLCMFAAVFAGVLLYAGLNDISAKNANVLIVLSSDNAVYREAVKGFESGAAKTGLVISKTEHVMAGEDRDIPAAVADKAYDAVFAIGTKAFEAAKKMESKTAVIFCMIFVDPASYSGSSSGVTLSIPPDIKLAKIKEFLPGRKKIGIVYTTESAALFNELSAKSKAAGLETVGVQAAGASDFLKSFDEVSKTADCYLMLPDGKLYGAQAVKELFTGSVSKKLPVIGLSSIYTRAGAFFSLDYDYTDLGMQCGELAFELAGTAGKAKSRVIFPRKVNTSVNAAVAKALGIDITGQSGKADQIFGN